MCRLSYYLNLKTKLDVSLYHKMAKKQKQKQTKMKKPKNHSQQREVKAALANNCNTGVEF